MPFFDEIDELFKHEMENLRRMFKENKNSDAPIQPQVEERDGVRTFRWGPIVYGRTTTVGPDGRMHTQEWTNLPEDARQQFEEHLKKFSFRMPPPLERQPTSPIPDPLPPDRPFPGPQPQLQPKAEDYLIDVIDTNDGFVAIFDTPASNTQDVDARVNGKQIQLWIRGRLFRELELPIPVELTSLHFKNGVVELKLQSKQPSVEPTAKEE